MGRTALIYGGISGLIVITTMIIGMTVGGKDSATGGQVFGYLVMLVALSMIFLGIKRYRDRELGGVIRFLPAFLLGLGIAAVAGVMYVTVWEIYLASTDHAFINDYVAAQIEAKEAAGLTGEALAQEVAKLEQMQAQYGNIFFRVPITFLEIFPVGLIIALISAAILRNPGVLPDRGAGA